MSESQPDLLVSLAGLIPTLALAVHYAGEYRKAAGKGMGTVFKIVDRTLTVLLLIELAFIVLLFGIGWWISSR